MNKGRIKITEEEYKSLRDSLLSWEWLTETFDSITNKSIYKLTKKGTNIYVTILRAVGVDSLVNGYKLKLNEFFTTEVETYQGKTDEFEMYLQAIIKGGVLTKTYDYENNIEKYELTPYGAKLFVAFFVSNNRQVGTLPGDNLAKFMKHMSKMPEYSIKFSEFMNNIAKGFQAFDNQRGTTGKKSTNNFDDFVPNYGKMNIGNYTSFGRQKPYTKTKKKKTKKSKQKRQTIDEVSNHFSHLGRNMMNENDLGKGFRY